MEISNKPLTTKDNVRKIASNYDCETKYQGEKKIMYVIGLNAKECIEYIKSTFSISFTMEVDLIKKETIS